MNISSQTEEKIIQKFFDLFITAQYKYLILNKDGKYYTYNTYENKKHQPLKKWHIIEHLNGKHTLGIFAANYVTSFICFDVDIIDPINAKWTVYKLIDALISLGIPENYIYTSTSGNKGYHVDIYFKDSLINGIVKDFYNIVMDRIDKTYIKGEIELRPTNQGLKLPLGRNFKNKNQSTNKCWYVDNQDLTPIKSIKYILDIKQIETEIIKNIVEKENDILIFEHKANKEEAYKVETVKGYIDSKYQSLDAYENNVDSNATIERAKKLDQYGLQFTGTRHNSLYDLCKYYKYLGMDEEENENILIEWMNEQDTRKYKTDIKDCYKDIKEIVKYIYKNDINLINHQKEIIVTYNEVLEILKAKSKNEKLLLYAMLIHSKRYANEKEIFYMTYNQMVHTTGLSERTVKRLVNKLEQINLLEIIERNKAIFDNNGNLITKRPNKYKVLIEDEEDDPFKYVIINNTESNFNNTLLNMFNLNELKIILPDRHYREIYKASN